MPHAAPPRLTLRRFLHELWLEIHKDQLVDVSAQLAYASLLALFPFIIFLFTLLAFLPVQGAADQILDTLARLMPVGTMALVQTTVHGIVRIQNGKLLAVSIVGSTWAASGGVNALTKALNAAYDVVETRTWVRRRLTSLAITVAGSLLLIVAAVALLVGPHLIERASSFFGLGVHDAVVHTWAMLRWPATIAAMSILLAMLYWACPNVRHPFQLVTVGSVFAIPAWAGVSLLFNMYVSHLGRFNKTYGALGTAVVLLVWIYLSGFIVLLGGEMNAILRKHVDETELARRHAEAEELAMEAAGEEEQEQAK